MQPPNSVSEIPENFKANEQIRALSILVKKKSSTFPSHFSFGYTLLIFQTDYFGGKV